MGTRGAVKIIAEGTREGVLAMTPGIYAGREGLEVFPPPLAEGRVYRKFISCYDGHACAGASVGCAFGKGLNVTAIRKAPIPIAQEPM